MGVNGVAITNVTSRPKHPRRHWVRARVFAPICSKLAFLAVLLFFSKGTRCWGYAFEAVYTVQSLGGR